MEKSTNYDKPNALWRWIIVAIALSLYFNLSAFISGVQDGWNESCKDTTEVKINLDRFSSLTKFVSFVVTSVFNTTIK